MGRWVRAQKARRYVGGRSCSFCSESRPHALVRETKPLVCARHQALAQGRVPYELHHVAGETNHPTATVLAPINGHRGVLTPEMYEWPMATRENPDRSPLLAAAGALRGFRDTVNYLMDELLLPPALLLEKVDCILRGRFGPSYLIELGIVEVDEESNGSANDAPVRPAGLPPAAR
jgi:hypothetical protein